MYIVKTKVTTQIICIFVYAFAKRLERLACYIKDVIFTCGFNTFKIGECSDLLVKASD